MSLKDVMKNNSERVLTQESGDLESIGFWYCSTTKEVKSGATSYPAARLKYCYL